MANRFFSKEKLRRELPSFVWEAYRILKSPLAQMAVWRDYLYTLSSTKFIEDQKCSSFSNKKLALIASMTDSILQLKLEAFLGAGLKRNGWKVIVLTTSRSNSWARRYFRAFGICNFLYWDEIELTFDQIEQCRKDSEDFLSIQPLDFQSVKTWNFQGSWIGPQILSSIARESHKGAPNLSDPSVAGRMKKILPATLERTFKAKALIQDLRPDFMYAIESNYALMGPIVDQAIVQGVDVAQVAQPSREDALIIRRLNPKTRRFHPNSLTAESFSWIQKNVSWNADCETELDEEFANRYGGKWFIQNRNQIGTKLKTRKQIEKQLDLDPSKKISVIFSHVLWDANLFYGDDLFIDYEDWFIQTAKAACANTQLNWLIKIHPANLWKRARDRVKGELTEEALIREHIGNLPNHVKLLAPNIDISTLSLFELADYGVTVRGTTGMELPCFGKRLITAGTGRYSGFGFTTDSASKEEYLARLANLQNLAPMTQEETSKAKLFAFGVFKLRPFLLTSCRCFFQYKKVGHHPLDHNLELTSSSWNEIDKNGDLQEWCFWVNDPAAVDYLNKNEIKLN